MHFIEQCKHGVIFQQCRCPHSNKQVTIVDCAEAGCGQSVVFTDEEITRIAYEEIFNSARSMIEDWIDEEREYSKENFFKIRKRCFELIDELEQRYVQDYNTK